MIFLHLEHFQNTCRCTLGVWNLDVGLPLRSWNSDQILLIPSEIVQDVLYHQQVERKRDQETRMWCFPWNILGSLDDSHMTSAAFLKKIVTDTFEIPQNYSAEPEFHLLHGVSVVCLIVFIPLLGRPDIWRAEMMISHIKRRTFFGFRSIFLSLPDFLVKFSWSSTQPPTELCM